MRGDFREDAQAQHGRAIWNEFDDFFAAGQDYGVSRDVRREAVSIKLPFDAADGNAQFDGGGILEEAVARIRAVVYDIGAVRPMSSPGTRGHAIEARLERNGSRA